MRKAQKAQAKKAAAEKAQARTSRKAQVKKANQAIVEQAVQAKKAKRRAHRESTLPKGEANRVLDKLILLEQVIPPGEIVQVLHDTGCLDSRRCTLSFEVIFWFVLSMGLITNLSLRGLFKACRRLRGDEDTPHR